MSYFLYERKYLWEEKFSHEICLESFTYNEDVYHKSKVLISEKIALMAKEMPGTENHPLFSTIFLTPDNVENLKKICPEYFL